MAHSIVEEQNKKANIELLAAQRELYSRAKNHLAIALFLSVPLMIILAIVVMMLGNETSWMLILASFIVLIINDVFLLPLINEKKDTAAKIQELFDTHVLQLPWNKMAGDKPSPETIKYYADKHLAKPGNRKPLLNWYSDVLDSLPLDLCRIIAQRSNFSWDSKLRKRYKHGLILLSLIMAAIIITISAIMDMKVRDQLVMIIASVMPAIVFFIQQIRSQQLAIQSLDRFKAKTEALWQSALEEKKPTLIEARQLQDGLFNLRRTNPLIFDWLYSLSKKGQENGMYYAVETSISEYRQRKQNRTDI